MFLSSFLSPTTPFFESAFPLLFSLAFTALPLLFMATATAELAALVSWALFAQHVRGTVIGVRERLGRDFVAVYRYTDHLGVTQQAMSSLGSRRLAGKHTGAAVRLRVFPSRPESVREPRGGVGVLRALVFGFVVFITLLFQVPVIAMNYFLAKALGAHWLPWGQGAASIAAIALGIWWGRPGKPAVAEHKLGPLEAAENVTAERIRVLNEANRVDL